MSLFMPGANKKVKETNKLIILRELIDWEKRRYIVKQGFGTLKRRFQFERAS